MLLRPGERGKQPGKSIPMRGHARRKFINEEQESGIASEKVNADLVMSRRFNGYDHIEKFPHGYDPFSEGETTLRKKVVFKPNKDQIDAIKNKKKHAYPVMESNMSGYAPVKHERKFLAKNCNPPEVKTTAIMEAPVEHEIPTLEKNGDTIEMQSGYVFEYSENPDIQSYKQYSSSKKSQDSPAIVANANGITIEPHWENYSISNKKSSSIIAEDSGSYYGQNLPEFNKAHPSRKVKHQKNVEYSTQDIYDYDNTGRDDNKYLKPRKQKGSENLNYKTEAEYDYDIDTEIYYEDQHRKHQAGHNSSHKTEAEYDYDIDTEIYYEDQHRKHQAGHNSSHKTHESWDSQYAEKPVQTRRRKKKVQFAMDNETIKNYGDVGISADSRPVPEKKKSQGQEKEIRSENYDQRVESKSQDVGHGKRKSQTKTGHHYSTSALKGEERHSKFEIRSDRKTKHDHQDFIREGLAHKSYETEQLYGADERDISRLPNIRPVKQQVDPGVYVYTRPPELDVKTRIQQALEKSRKISTRSYDLDTNYNLQDNNDPHDPVLSENRKQLQTPSNPETNPLIESNQNSTVSMKYHTEKQGTNTVDVSNVSLPSGIQDPYEMNSGIDPQILKVTESKKHIAREGTIGTELAIEIKEEGLERTGLETNTRSRVPTIKSNLEAKGHKPVVYRKNIKTSNRREENTTENK